MMDEIMIVLAGRLNIIWDKKPIPPKNIIHANIEIIRLLKRYFPLYFELKGIVKDVTITMKTVPRIISK
jgi:hypothetical protein